MKNKIMLLALAITVVLLAFVLVEGLKLGKIEILSISEIINKDKNLQSKIEEASAITSINYPETIQKLEETYDEHEVQKSKYEQLVGLTDGNKNEIYETKQYDVGYLWKVIGKYAAKRNINLQIDVQKATVLNLYNLNFNIAGQYANTIQFITDIENNSDLNFRIYNFKMTGSGDGVNSTFTVKDVNLDPKTTITKADLETQTIDSMEEVQD